MWVSQTVNGSTQTMMETTSESTFAGGADDDHVSKHAMSYVRMDRPRRTVTGRVQQLLEAGVVVSPTILSLQSKPGAV